jgi:hypothetical protein
MDNEDKIILIACGVVTALFIFGIWYGWIV